MCFGTPNGPDSGGSKPNLLRSSIDAQKPVTSRLRRTEKKCWTSNDQISCERSAHCNRKNCAPDPRRLRAHLLTVLPERRLPCSASRSGTNQELQPLFLAARRKRHRRRVRAHLFTSRGSSSSYRTGEGRYAEIGSPFHLLGSVVR
jgi:hypothetical protein